MGKRFRRRAPAVAGGVTMAARPNATAGARHDPPQLAAMWVVAAAVLGVVVLAGSSSGAAPSPSSTSESTTTTTEACPPLTEDSTMAVAPTTIAPGQLIHIVATNIVDGFVPCPSGIGTLVIFHDGPTDPALLGDGVLVGTFDGADAVNGQVDAYVTVPDTTFRGPAQIEIFQLQIGRGAGPVDVTIVDPPPKPVASAQPVTTPLKLTG